MLAPPQGFNQRFGVTFPTLLDLSNEDYPASNAYGITSVPSLFLVEPDGTIVANRSTDSRSAIWKRWASAPVSPPFRPGR